MAPVPPRDPAAPLLHRVRVRDARGRGRALLVQPARLPPRASDRDAARARALCRGRERSCGGRSSRSGSISGSTPSASARSRACWRSSRRRSRSPSRSPLRPEPVPVAKAVPVRLDAAQPSRRIVVVGIDGLGVSDVTAEPPRLRVLARLARRGAPGALATLRPTEAPPLWTTLMTGRFPRDHGVLSATTYALARLEERVEPASEGRRDRPHRARRSRHATARGIDRQAAARAVERARRVRGALGPGARLGHAAPRGDPRLRGLSVLPPPEPASPRRPAPRSTRATCSTRSRRAPCGPTSSTLALVAGLADAPRAGPPLDDPRLQALAEGALGAGYQLLARGRGAHRRLPPGALRHRLSRLRRRRPQLLQRSASRGVRRRKARGRAPLRPRARALRRRCSVAS